MMLFLDTSDSERTALYLLDKDFFKVEIIPSRRTQAEKIHSEIKKFIKKYRVPLKRLDRVGVVVGPGHFSRVRTGVATANALGFALNLPTVGVKKLGTNLNFPAILKEKGQKMVDVYYEKDPNITKPNKK